MTISDHSIQDLHSIYCRMTGLQVALTLGRMFQWERWILRQWTADDLRLAIEVTRRKIKKGECTFARLRFPEFIGNDEKFEEYLAEARAINRQHEQRETPKEKILRETGRPKERQTDRPIGDVLAGLKALEQFRALKDTL